jgi:hypothetical protein
VRADTLRGRTLASALLCGLGLGACFDWTVRAGASADDAGLDASRPIDAQTVDGGELDGAVPSEAEAGPVDCPSLVDEARAARKAARTCQLASGHCATKVRDECDCDVFVAVGASAASDAFVAKAAEARAAGCTSHCAATCPSLPVQGGCVQSGTDLTCSP